MNLKEFYKSFIDISTQHPLVNDSITGDVYRLNSETHKYPLTCCGVQNISKQPNTITYNCYIYYVDRLQESHNNETEIHSVAITTLQQIVNKLTTFNENEILDFTIGSTYSLFQQKFADECAGAWVSVNITLRDEVGLCSDYIYVPTSNINLQSKYVVPTFEKQIIIPNDGFDGLSKVEVEAMPTYVNSDLYRNGIIIGKCNNGASGVDNNYSLDDADSIITPYLRVYESEWGKECQCIHTINGSVANARESTLVFRRDKKYTDDGVDKYPNVVNYEPIIVEGVEYSPIYADYWQMNRTFTVASGIYWIRFTLYKWDTHYAKFKIGDRILWESNIK